MIQDPGESELNIKAPSSASNRNWLKYQSIHTTNTSSYSGISSLEKEWRSAVLKSSFEDMSRLLSKNPELANWKDYITGNTALHLAAKINDMGLIRLLAGTYHADVESRNHGGLTPLHMAALGASEEATFELMSKFGAKASTRDYSGRLPVTYLPESPAGERLQSKLEQKSTGKCPTGDCHSLTFVAHQRH